MSRSAFLVSFTGLSKQLFNLKSVFKFHNHGVSVWEMYRFIIFLGIEIYFIKQCLLNLCPLNVGAKLLSDLVIFSIFSSDIPLDFDESIQVMPLKYLMYFLAGLNTKWFQNIHEKKYFAPLGTLNLCIKSFDNPANNVALTFFDSSFNSFLFDVTFFILLSKSFVFTNIAISLLLAKFACFSPAVKSCNVNLCKNSYVVIYL